jgi:hypothetical protein
MSQMSQMKIAGTRGVGTRIVMHRMSWIERCLMLCAVILLISLQFAMQVSAAASLFIPQGIYAVGDAITIDVNDSLGRLDVLHETSTYRYIGSPEGNISFTPQLPGLYTFNLVKDEQVIDSVNIFVYESQAAGEHAKDLLWTEPATVKVGDVVTLHLPIADGCKVVIRSGDLYYSYQGNLTGNLTFIPVQAGNYIVEIGRAHV